ncbi:hypothetical protein M2222_000903 [Bradyrhizobium elkanii]|nr:hypothetical protein [Bradyrhizobium elkanii]MCS3558581.1 hypothetical protein [Bradyrhizobium elkanii]
MPQSEADPGAHGHATIQMTFDTYGHLFKDTDADQRAAEDIQARLLGS